jgi:hypothetical protein
MKAYLADARSTTHRRGKIKLHFIEKKRVCNTSNNINTNNINTTTIQFITPSGIRWIHGW